MYSTNSINLLRKRIVNRFNYRKEIFNIIQRNLPQYKQKNSDKYVELYYYADSNKKNKIRKIEIYLNDDGIVLSEFISIKKDISDTYEMEINNKYNNKYNLIANNIGPIGCNGIPRFRNSSYDIDRLEEILSDHYLQTFFGNKIMTSTEKIIMSYL